MVGRLFWILMTKFAVFCQKKMQLIPPEHDGLVKTGNFLSAPNEIIPLCHPADFCMINWLKAQKKIYEESITKQKTV